MFVTSQAGAAEGVTLDKHALTSLLPGLIDHSLPAGLFPGMSQVGARIYSLSMRAIGSYPGYILSRGV